MDLTRIICVVFSAALAWPAPGVAQSPPLSPASGPVAREPLRPADRSFPAGRGADVLRPALEQNRALRVIEPELRQGQEVGWPRDFAAPQAAGEAAPGLTGDAPGEDNDIFTQWSDDPDRYLTRDALGTGLMSTPADQTPSEGTGSGPQAAIRVAEIVPSRAVRYDQLSERALNAKQVIAGLPVYGLDGRQIGSSVDLFVGADSQMLALVAEIGRFWSLADIQVSIPWYMVEVDTGGLTVPLTQDSIDEYGLLDPDRLGATTLANAVQAGVEAVPSGPRAWRVSALIGDVVRVDDAAIAAPFVYVDDLLISDGRLAAIAVSIAPSDALGAGTR